MIDIHIKTFEELSTKDLYEVLRLRSEVFVVEQDCVYQDVDDKDQKALHIIGYKNSRVVAYARAFRPGDYFDLASIGRVVVAIGERQHKYGYDIMKASIKAIEEHFGARQVKLSAQTYLIRFYNQLGFKEIGEAYLEDNIPHIAMVKS